MDDPSEMNAEQNTVVLENEEVMWSAPIDGGPAVVVETIPMTYAEGTLTAQGGHHMVTGHVTTGQNGEQYASQLDNMEYDYLYANNVSTNHSHVNVSAENHMGVRQRVMDFAML